MFFFLSEKSAYLFNRRCPNFFRQKMVFFNIITYFFLKVKFREISRAYKGADFQQKNLHMGDRSETTAVAVITVL